MKSYLFPAVSLALIIFTAPGCCRKTTTVEQKPEYRPALETAAGPPVIVYKTKLDYIDKVPIILSADRKEVISYPAKTDIYYKGELAYPLKVGNGYLLDRRGINENVAFLEITYEEYSNFEHTPGPEELLRLVIDADPLLEMWHCGSLYDYKNLESELANKAEGGLFPGCTRLK